MWLQRSQPTCANNRASNLQNLFFLLVWALLLILESVTCTRHLTKNVGCIRQIAVLRSSRKMQHAFFVASNIMAPYRSLQGHQKAMLARIRAGPAVYVGSRRSEMVQRFLVRFPGLSAVFSLEKCLAHRLPGPRRGKGPLGPADFPTYLLLSGNGHRLPEEVLDSISRLIYANCVHRHCPNLALGWH